MFVYNLPLTFLGEFKIFTHCENKSSILVCLLADSVGLCTDFSVGNFVDKYGEVWWITVLIRCV